MKEKTKQANYRLPESLLSDLAEVAEEIKTPQTSIVTAAVQARVVSLKKQIERRKERELAVATG
jgi:hypothetical protein